MSNASQENLVQALIDTKEQACIIVKPEGKVICLNQRFREIFSDFPEADFDTFIGQLNIKPQSTLKDLKSKRTLEYTIGKQRTFWCAQKLSIPSMGDTLLIEITFQNNEENLKQIRDHYENILKSLPAHVYWKDKNSKVLGCNDQQVESLGLSHAEIVGTTPANNLGTVHSNQIKQNDKLVMKTGQSMTFEEPDQTGSGTIINYLSRKAPLKDPAGNVTGVVGVSFDITEIVTREKELTEQKKKAEVTLEQIVANMPGHVFWKGLDGKYLGCNDAQAKALGLRSREEIKAFVPYSKLTAEQKVITIANDERVIKEGKTIAGEEPLTNKDGKIRVFYTQKTPIRDQEGQISGILGTSIDVTAEKKAEELEREKIINEKNARALKTYAGAIAHELRGPLTVMDAMAARLRMILPRIVSQNQKADAAKPKKLPAMDIKYLETIPDELTTLIADTSKFTELTLKNIKLGVGIGPVKTLSINKCLQNTLRMFEGKTDVKIDWQQSRGFLVKAEPTALSHVISNLLRNAITHIKKVRKGEITIWTEASSEKNTLHIKDTGSGIPKNVLPKIFDAYYSKTRHGTGVGLAYCKEAMERFCGEITCESESGKYTHFKLHFPAVKK